MVKTRKYLPLSSVITGIVLLPWIPFLAVRLFHHELYRVIDAATFLLFHNVAEIFSIIVSFSIFGVGWYTYEQSKNSHALFLSASFLAVGLMDFMHTLSYPGMPPFITPNYPSKSSQFWVAVRIFSAAVFLASAYITPQTRNRWLSKQTLMTVALTTSLLTFTVIIYFPNEIPATYISGIGLTPFKTRSEYLIIALFALAFAAYFRNLMKSGNRINLLYMCALLLSIISDFAFTGYKSVFDTYNMLGHLYKAAAYLMIYRAIFTGSVKEPYIRLADARKSLLIELEARQRVKNEVMKLNEELEMRVKERTRELELRQQEAEAAKCEADMANKAKSEFIANMSHELRTPLNSVIGFTTVLEEEMAGQLNEKQHRYVNNILSSARHLLNLIRDILDLSKVEAGKMELELSLVAVRQFLDGSISILLEKAFLLGVTISLHVPDEENQEIEVDERKMKQIMFNLLSNAVKFTPDGGRVRVGVRQEPTGFMEISVEDTGIGIRTEEMDKLFNEFTQLESPYDKSHEGSGLGLALTRQLVELHGGRIRVESEFGSGSRFIFTVPIRQMQDQTVTKGW
jgi:signal transduction histidine kinase